MATQSPHRFNLNAFHPFYKAGTEEFASGTPQMAHKVAEALKKYKIIMLGGHGSFATGQTLDEAFHWSSTLEESCQIALAVKIRIEGSE